tara:strand:+ start:2446 stop:4860 length:2415 start_codon:yes stop_codon:yes gene_type:complete
MTSLKDIIEQKSLELIEQSELFPLHEQRAFLLNETKDNPELKKRVLSIFDANNGSGSFLITGGGLEPNIDDPIPEIIGAYRIEREIGRGGMGAVYFGRQMSTDFDHVAAIKVVRKDATSPQLIERLREERRALARLKHPNIAQMYDGGELPDGAPYFIMEYVTGIPLNQFLSDNNVALHKILSLFLDICHAVSFAHRNLLIHRDLSPANILITEDQHVKLIDFGIARSLNDEATAPSQNPETSMTIGYAAPERANGASVLTVTDIYSLGIILKDMMQNTDAPRRDDLIAIATKAHASSPEERYQNVDTLINDIVAYQKQEPVSAVNGGWTYELSRFVGRRKIAVVSGTIIFSVIIISSIVLSILYLRAVEAEQMAEERFTKVRELANFIMFDFQDEVAKLEGSTPARELLTKTAIGYLDSLSSNTNNKVALKIEVALGYKRLSDIIGNPSSPHLGQRETAGQLITKSANQITELRKKYPNTPNILRTFISIIDAQAVFEAFSNMNFDRAIILITDAQEASRTLLSHSKKLPLDQEKDAYLNQIHGYFLQKMGQYSEALAQTGKSLDKYNVLNSEVPNNITIQMGRARAYITHGETVAWQTYTNQQDMEIALPYFNKGIQELRHLSNSPNPTFKLKTQLIIALLKRANTTCYMPNHFDEGIDDLSMAANMAERLSKIDPRNIRLLEHLAHIAIQKGDCFASSGMLPQAEKASQEAVLRREAILRFQPENPNLLLDLIIALNVVADIQSRNNNWQEACVNSKRMNTIWNRYDKLHLELADYYTEQKKTSDELAIKCTTRQNSVNEK